MRILVRLNNPLDSYRYTEILDKNNIEYSMTGLGIDDSSIEYLNIWVDHLQYEKANNLIRSEHEYFTKCPKCGSIDIRLNFKKNFIITLLIFLKALITGNTSSSFNKYTCKECSAIF